MKQKSIKKNMLMSIILTSSNFIFPVITFSYVTRILLPAGTGKVDFVSSVLSYFSYIAILGIPAYGIREVAKFRDDKEKMSHLVQELLMINLISTMVSYILLILAVIILPRLYEEKELFVVMGYSILFNTLGLEWVYQGLEEYTYITIRSVLLKAVSVLLTFLLIKNQEDVIWYGFLHVFTNSASYLFNFLHIRKFVSFKNKRKLNLKQHLKPILTLFTASIIISIYANFDVIMIGFISTEHEVGLYGAALKIKAIILSVSTAITAVLIPRMSYYLKDRDIERASDLIEKSFRVSMDLAIPIACYIFVFAKECVVFLCGEEYFGAVPTLRILICCILPLILTNLFGNQILIPLGDEKRYSQSVFIGMWINLFLNVALIPKMGAFGAAIGTLITEIWNVCWMSGGAKTYRKMLLKPKLLFTYILPLSISILVTALLSVYLDISVIWRLIINGICFFGIYYGILLFEKEPIVYNQVKKIIICLPRKVNEMGSLQMKKIDIKLRNTENLSPIGRGIKSSAFPTWTILSERNYIFKNHGVSYNIILGMEDALCDKGAYLVTISPKIDIANRLVHKISEPFIKNELVLFRDRSIQINSTYYLYISMGYAGLKMVIPTLKSISKKTNHVVLYCFDTWESVYNNWDEAFSEIQPKAIFFAYKKARDFFSKKYKNCFFLPQSVDNRIFYPRKVKKERLFMQMGRRNECIHNMILAYLQEHNIDDSSGNYIYEREKGKVIFPDINELAIEICKSMFFVAAPQSLENKNLTGNISECTARFYEAMACKTLIIGFKPDTYNELFPEDSMVELKPDGSDFTQKIDCFLEHPNEYEDIVNKNYEYLMEHHRWINRYETMVNALKQS